MNIYELDKQATPGPFITIPQKHTDDICITQAGDPPGNVVANVWFKDDPVGKANAAMLAHCRNNMVPLLRAAQRIVNLISDDESRYEAWKEEVEELSDACSEAEKVS